MAKKRAFNEIIWHGSTIHHDEAFVCPLAVIMYGTSKQFFSSSCLTGYKYIDIALCCLGNEIKARPQ